VNGSPEDQKEASLGDWAGHLFSLPWKMLFATCPPADYWNGWVCFFGALAYIGILTGFVGDLASEGI
jgi:solute carrier family 8 (sodium/calcium exchanger)